MKKLLAAIALVSLMALEGAANQATVDGRTWVYSVVNGGAQIGFEDEGLSGRWNYGLAWDDMGPRSQYLGLVPEDGFTEGGWPMINTKDLKIPSELGGMPVTSIGAVAFSQLIFEGGGGVT